MPALNEGMMRGAIAVICDQGTTNMKKTGQRAEDDEGKKK